VLEPTVPLLHIFHHRYQGLIVDIAKEALLHCGRVVVGTVEGTDDGIRWNWNMRATNHGAEP